MYYSVLIGIAISVAAVIAGGKTMGDNEKKLKAARSLVQAFESEKEPERLNEAARALQSVNLRREYDAVKRHELRAHCLATWLQILQIIDSNLQPNFDQRDVPPKSVQPPPTSSGVVYPPGAAPAVIDDPKARAEYEKAVKENREKQENYRLQIYFKRLNEDISPVAEDFIRNSYVRVQNDRDEVKAAVEKTITDQTRKDRLISILLPAGADDDE